MPRAGLEPAQPKGRGILNPLCLPISPPGHLWRRVPESNRGTRICNPLHDHSANAPQLLNLLRDWSGKRDSNSRPQPWQGCALPTELFPHLVSFVLIIIEERFGAGNETRTRDPNLGKVVLYQLSYSRVFLTPVQTKFFIGTGSALYEKNA